MPDRATSHATACRLARTIGLLYVVIAVLAAFGEVFVRGGMLVSGNASQTAANILAKQQLYRAAGVADLIVLACDVVVAILFYALLKEVGRTVSQIAAAFRLSLVAVNGAAVLTHFLPLMLLRGDPALSAIPKAQLQALSELSLKLHSTAFSLAIVFFGIHCVLVGYLLYRSDFVPRLFGGLWILAGTLYVIHSVVVFLAVSLTGSTADIILLVAGLSELSLIPYFILIGIKRAK